MANRPNYGGDEGGGAPQGGAMQQMGKLLLGVLALCVALFYGYKKLGGGGGGEYTTIPKEMQITYMPSDFKSKLDEDKTLKILSNPGRYRTEFDEMVYDLNMSILKHVSNRMNLPDSLSGNLEKEYRKHHGYLKQLYFNDIISLRDTSAANYEQWYANDGAKAVAALQEVASKYTCFFVNAVTLELVANKRGTIAGKGKKVDTPCGIAMTEALKPIISRLQEKAAIEDFSKSKGLLKEKVEKVIAELATIEVRDKKAMNKELQTKVWGYNVSQTELEISAMSIMKIGFKLDDYFNIDVSDKRREVVVTLPQPKILSHEVYPKVDKLDVGWMRELSNADFNKNFNALRAEFRSDAMESDVFDKSKVQAKELMSVMLEPLVKSINSKYVLKVKFKGSDVLPDSPDVDEAKVSPRSYDSEETTTSKPTKKKVTEQSEDEPTEEVKPKKKPKNFIPE